MRKKEDSSPIPFYLGRTKNEMTIFPYKIFIIYMGNEVVLSNIQFSES